MAAASIPEIESVVAKWCVSISSWPILLLETLHLFNTFVSKFICYGFGLLRWPRLTLHNNHLSSFFEATLYISHNRMNYRVASYDPNRHQGDMYMGLVLVWASGKAPSKDPWKGPKDYRRSRVLLIV